MSKLKRIRNVMKGDSLQGQVLRGSSWTMIGFGLGNAIRLGSTLFLTRLLTPDVFGLMALAGVIIAGANMLSDVGTGPSVVRSERGDDEAFLRTAWSIQTIRGAVICVLVCIAAWPVSQIYDQPILFPLICAMSASAVLEGFVSISQKRCRRHMQLKPLVLMELAIQISVTVLSVIAAWWLQSVWALAIGGIAGSALRLTFSHFFLPKFTHRFEFERDALREIISFGRWLVLATLLTYIGDKGLQAIMGGLVDIKTLGFIALATTISMAFGDLVKRVVNSTVFPSVAKVNRERPQELRRVLGRVKKMITFAAIPPFLFIALIGQPLIDLIYDDRYASVGAMLCFFALNAALSMVSMPYQNLALAIGDGRYHAQFMFLNTTARVIGLYLGFQLGGVYGMIVGVGIGTIVSTFSSMYWAHSKGLAWLRYDFAPMALISLCMAVAWIYVVPPL